MAADFVVKKMSKDEAEWFRQNSYENALWDYHHGLYRAEKRGLEKGIEQGERKKALETASLMKANKMPVQDIAKYTGLAVEEIQSL